MKLVNDQFTFASGYWSQSYFHIHPAEIRFMLVLIYYQNYEIHFPCSSWAQIRLSLNWWWFKKIVTEGKRTHCLDYSYFLYPKNPSLNVWYFKLISIDLDIDILLHNSFCYPRHTRSGVKAAIQQLFQQAGLVLPAVHAQNVLTRPIFIF